MLDYTDVHHATGKNYVEMPVSDAGNSFHLKPDSESIDNDDGKKANLIMASASVLP